MLSFIKKVAILCALVEKSLAFLPTSKAFAETRVVALKGFQTEPELLPTRKDVINSISVSIFSLIAAPRLSSAEEDLALQPLVAVAGDTKKIFNEGRALEMQGNIAAAQRLYAKVTKIAPNFIYGWSNLGNTQVALGALEPAEDSYTRAIDLCVENRKKEEEKFGVPRCNDLYLLHLNRGSLRVNNKMAKEALKDLEMADYLRAKPDAVILQNRARARELNGLYGAADRDYTVAISMTSNEVSPFWLRSGTYT
jgi:tetratricopeptide (TPR) repeat protein